MEICRQRHSILRPWLLIQNPLQTEMHAQDGMLSKPGAAKDSLESLRSLSSGLGPAMNPRLEFRPHRSVAGLVVRSVMQQHLELSSEQQRKSMSELANKR